MELREISVNLEQRLRSQALELQSALSVRFTPPDESCTDWEQVEFIHRVSGVLTQMDILMDEIKEPCDVTGFCDDCMGG